MLEDHFQISFEGVSPVNQSPDGEKKQKAVVNWDRNRSKSHAQTWSELGFTELLLILYYVTCRMDPQRHRWIQVRPPARSSSSGVTINLTWINNNTTTTIWKQGIVFVFIKKKRNKWRVWRFEARAVSEWGKENAVPKNAHKRLIYSTGNLSLVPSFAFPRCIYLMTKTDHLDVWRKQNLWNLIAMKEHQLDVWECLT